jgi:hypothetical protein
MASFIGCFFILQANQVLISSLTVLPAGSSILYYMLGAQLFLCIDAALFLQPEPVPHREHSNTNNPGNRM